MCCTAGRVRPMTTRHCSSSSIAWIRPRPTSTTSAARGSMPLLRYGFDLADPNKWSLVKGFSVLRHFERETDNDYQGGHLNFELKMFDRSRWSSAARIANTSSRRTRAAPSQRSDQPDARASSASRRTTSAACTSTATGSICRPERRHAFFAPNIDAFREIDWLRLQLRQQYGDCPPVESVESRATSSSVNEFDNSCFIQVDWDFELFDRRLFGNVGVRQRRHAGRSRTGYTTNVAATGPRPLRSTNEYSDTAVDQRGVPAHRRHDRAWRLGESDGAADAQQPRAEHHRAHDADHRLGAVGSLTIGNPELSPFRAENFDLSVEWYFADGGLLSVARVQERRVQLPADSLDRGHASRSLLARSHSPRSCRRRRAAARLDARWHGGRPGTLRHPPVPGRARRRDQGLRDQPTSRTSTFLPGFLKNFGVQANYTKLTSELQYILDPGQPAPPVMPQVDAGGPFLGASPKSANATLYYETPKWSARVSWAYRGGLRDPVSDRRGHLRAGPDPADEPCDAPLDQRLHRQQGDEEHRCQGDLTGDRLPVVLRRGTEPHQPDRGSLGVLRKIRWSRSTRAPAGRSSPGSG